MSKGSQRTDRLEGSEDISQHPEAYLRVYRTVGPLTVWIMDGEVIRNWVHVDFTEGDNQQHSPWMPKGEIWIDACNEDEADVTLIHELHEFNRMRLDGLSYDEAHDSANTVEIQARRNPDQRTSLLQAEIDIIEKQPPEVKSMARKDAGAMFTKLLDSQTEASADTRQVRVICSTDSVDRMGDVIMQDGIDLTHYRKNAVVLWGHDPNKPVARTIDIGVRNNRLEATVQFPPEGDDEDSDWVYGKIKSGLVNATSVGFIPREYAPLDPKQPWGGYKFLKSELLEFSFVSVPANQDALIIGRSIIRGSLRLPVHKASEWKCGTARDLPIDEESTWDGSAAEKAVFDHFGFDGDKPDTAGAAKAFLFHDAANPEKKGSYKEPIATVKDGKCVAVAAGVRAAASRLSATQGPSSEVKAEAEAVIKAYEKRFSKAQGEGTNADGSAVVGPYCGKAKGEECGMKDPQACSVHCDKSKQIKSGRRVSKDNLDRCQKALDHIGAAMDHVKAVMNSNDPDDDGDDDSPGSKNDPDGDGPALMGEPKNAEERLEEVRHILLSN